MLDDLDDLHDIEIDDIDENLYVCNLFALHIQIDNIALCIFPISRSDEESFSETKIRLEDDEGYADDGQGTIYFLVMFFLLLLLSV